MCGPRRRLHPLVTNGRSSPARRDWRRGNAGMCVAKLVTQPRIDIKPEKGRVPNMRFLQKGTHTFGFQVDLQESCGLMLGL